MKITSKSNRRMKESFRVIDNTKEAAIIQVVANNVISADFPEFSTKVKDYILKNELNLEEKLNTPIFSVWGLFDGEKAVGFLIGFGPIRGIVELHWLGIIKDYQGKGLGRKAVEFFINWAKKEGAHRIHCYSSKENLKFYEKLGFENVGLIKKNYWGEDDYLMNKIIQEPKEENFLR